jgi:hypothetical protein
MCAWNLTVGTVNVWRRKNTLTSTPSWWHIANKYVLFTRTCAYCACAISPYTSFYYRVLFVQDTILLYEAVCSFIGEFLSISKKLDSVRLNGEKLINNSTKYIVPQYLPQSQLPIKSFVKGRPEKTVFFEPGSEIVPANIHPFGGCK